MMMAISLMRTPSGATNVVKFQSGILLKKTANAFDLIVILMVANRVILHGLFVLNASSTFIERNRSLTTLPESTPHHQN